MVVEERLPGLRRRSMFSGQQWRYGSFRDGDAQLEQLPVDAGRAPKRVGSRHLLDQGSNRRAGFWATALPPRNPGPEEAKVIDFNNLTVKIHRSSVRGAIYPARP